jgi:hypothetical protein
MLIDFHVVVPNEASANRLATVARDLGYRVSVFESPKCSLPWTCQCSTRMVPTYESVIAVQDELAEICKPFGGIPDGWGSFGNRPGG